MLPYLREHPGDPGRLHAEGRATRVAVEDARERVAAAGHVAVDFAALGAALCSVTAHKLGGPKGAAALLVRRGLRLPPLVVGGAQERARRGGIENVPAIVGFGAAADELTGRLEHDAERERVLTERLVREATAAV